MRRAKMRIAASRWSVAVGLLAGLALGACADVSGPRKRPEIETIFPDAVFGGQRRAVTVTGRGFGEGLYQLRSRRTGVSVANVQVESDSVLVGELFVAPTTQVGSTTIYLEVDGEELNALPFQVIPPPQTAIDSIRPQVALRGDTVAATIHGAGFVADSTTLSIVGDGLQVAELTVVSETRLDVVLVVDGSTPPGTRQLRAATYGQETAPLPMEIALRPTASLHWISGGGLSDTISTLLDTVTIEVRDDRGVAQPGVGVVFSGIRLPGLGVPPSAYLTLAPPPLYSFSTSLLALSTGADGRAAVTVRNGHLAGEARVVFSVTEPALADSVMYTILSGAPRRVRLNPRIGTILVNDTLRFTPQLLDRSGNVVPDTVGSVAIEGAEATLEGEGVVRGASLGNAIVRATWGTTTDSAELAVVPSVRIAAVRQQSSAAPRAVLLQELTGADERIVASTLGAGFGVFSPFFQPATGQLAIESGRTNYETGVLWVGDTLGGFEQQTLATPSLEYQHLPVISADGEWLYFTGQTFSVQNEVWRIRIGEDSVERLTPEVASREGDFHPTPSPDGQYIAYTQWRDEAYSLQVMNLSTRESSTIASGLHGGSRWSPTGEWIAALREGALWLIAPDGLTSRHLAPSFTDFQSPPNWSPDGKWLIVRRAGLQELINIETDVRIRLPGTALIRDASFVIVR